MHDRPAIGIGIDAVEIERFQYWHTYSATKLARIYSPAEIDYCCAIISKSAERFAARFAAREALWKALSQAGIFIPFLSLCRSCSILVTERGPQLTVDHEAVSSLVPLLSLSHTKTMALAMIVLQPVR